MSPQAPDGQFLSDGARVILETRGPPETQLRRGQELAAKLLFEGRYFSRARGGGDEEVARLATLEGTLSRSEAGPDQLRFTGQLDAAGKPVGLVRAETIGENASGASEKKEAAPKEETQLRVLRFFFDERQFQDVSPKIGEPTELLVRMKPKRFRYCEVSVGLEVNGSEEANALHNDVLDVLITRENPRRFGLEVLLQNPDGSPLAAMEFQVFQDGVLVDTVVTDEGGVAFVSSHDPSRPCALVVANRAPLVLAGGREADPTLDPPPPEDVDVVALDDGCQVELADASQVVPPDLVGDSVLV